jgi:hypothetical protein
MIVNREVKLPFRKKPVGLFRCTTCESVVVDSQRSLKSHGGHKLKRPFKISLWEELQLILGLIK